MRCEHFILFTHAILGAQSECPAPRQALAVIWVSPAASSVATGSQHTRDIRYMHACRVFLT